MGRCYPVVKHRLLADMRQPVMESDSAVCDRACISRKCAREFWWSRYCTGSNVRNCENRSCLQAIVLTTQDVHDGKIVFTVQEQSVICVFCPFVVLKKRGFGSCPPSSHYATKKKTQHLRQDQSNCLDPGWCCEGRSCQTAWCASLHHHQAASALPGHQQR